VRNRWGILAVLFAVRATMAFQFQSVAAVAPLLGSEFGVSIADIGVLIGLYFAPGIALALPGGAIGQRFGDKATVLGALLLMLAGSVAMTFAASWSLQIAGRLVAGAGGVILSVQLTKMLTDWFAGKEIATAMAIFVNSWPAGVAISLLVLPLIGTTHGVGAVHLSVAAFSGCAIVLLTIAYRSPGDAPVASTTSLRLDRGGPDLGPVQCRLRGDLQLRAFVAGRTWLVDRIGRVDHQHRVMAGGVLRSVGRLCCGSDQAAGNGSGRRLRRVCDADDRAAA
jgi:MFS family permease